MFWLLIAAGAVVTASVHPQSRAAAKDVPWMPLAVVVGLSVFGDKLKSIGTDSVREFEDRKYRREYWQYGKRLR